MKNLIISPLTEDDVRRIFHEEMKKLVDEIKPNEPIHDQTGGVELASEITGYSASTIYRLTSKCEVPFFKKRGRLTFSRKALSSWLARREMEIIADIC